MGITIFTDSPASMMTSRLHFVLLAAAVAGLVFPVRGQSVATISVDADQVSGPVNRRIFGQNINAGDDARIFSSDTTNPNLIQRGEGFWDPERGAPIPLVVRQSKAVDMSMLRYPGGCLVHNYDWRRTVGPQAKARGWLFGLDEYLRLCDAIGATPLITVSDYVLPADQMPENAAGLVEYLNSPADAAHPWAMKRAEWGHPAPYHVAWFELGNESIHGNHRVLPHRQYTPEQYAAYANATAAAMRRVDPGIRIGIVMTPGPGTDVNNAWNRTVVRLAGASADFVVLHVYAPQEKADIPADLLMQAMMVAPQHIEERLADYHRMIRQQLGHDLPLAITEFNGALEQPAWRLSFGDALECADLIRVFLEPASNVVLACYWDFVNGPFGMLRTTMLSPSGEPASEAPALLLYKLWAAHFGSQLVQVNVQSPVADFPGAGSEEASRGSVAEPRQRLQTVDPMQYRVPPDTPADNLQIHWQKSGVSIDVENLSGSIHPVLARIPRPSTNPGIPVEISLSVDARFIPDAGSDPITMGIGLRDSRDANADRSGAELDANTGTWRHFNVTYRLGAQTPSVDLIARLSTDGRKISGTLQLHNLIVVDFASAHDSAYPLLTSSASLSSEGHSLYLIVLNKSDSDSIPTTIRLRGFSADEARYWQVSAPALTSGSATTESQADTRLSLSGSGLASHVFPARSMTAIEFRQ